MNKDIFKKYMRVKDPNKAHAVLSASGSDRWMSCPGSVRLSEGIPQQDSEASIIGTNSHTLLQFILENPDYEEILKSKKADAFKDFIAFSQDQLQSVEVASDFVTAECARLEKRNGRRPTLLVEQKVELEGVGFGTADIIIYQSFGVLHVMDYKNGKYKVEAENNIQLLYYAHAVADRYGWDFRELWITIIQPNANHKAGPIRTWKTTPDTLERAGKLLRDGAQETRKKNARLVPDNKYCYFCSAKNICPAQMEKRSEKVMSRFKQSFCNQF